jgi:pimeloyl-ACP methyl ester carboxylesterase
VTFVDAPAPVLAARVNGVVLHYTDSGTEGPTVMLLHGGMGDLGSWPHQQCALGSHYRVVAYSRRHSHPNRNEPQRTGRTHRVEDDVDDFLALQATLGTGPSHLVATSYGALLALAIALRSPGQVASLVLAEPPLHRWLCVNDAGQKLYDTFIRDVWQAAGMAFERGLQRHAMQLLTQGMWGRPMFGSWSEDRVDAAMRNAVAMHELTRVKDPFPDLDRGAVSRLRMPTLLLHGEHTSALHVQVVTELGGVMGHARRVEIPNAGHGAPHENPQAFNAEVVNFLESQAAPAGVSR